MTYKKGEKIKAHCNRCNGPKNHTVLHSEEEQHEEAPDDQYGGFLETSRYTMAQCNGCDAFNYLDDYWNTGMDDTVSRQWPLKLIRKEPDWLWNLFMSEGLDSYKHDFLREIYRALRNNAPRLVVIGIRALLEQVMIEKVGDAGNFVQNLDRFQQEGFISSVQRSAIEPVIEAGHASTHRRFKASTEQISDLLDVTESLIATIYIHRDMLANMNIPPRPARVKRVKPAT